MTASEFVVDADVRRDVVDAALRVVRERYVFPDVAKEIEAVTRRRVQDGEFDGISTGEALERALTLCLQEVSRDKHFDVRYFPEPLARQEAGQPVPGHRERVQQGGELGNFGFARVQRLLGNIGCLELHGFFDATVRGAGEAATAAMNFVAHTSALIIDIRQNGGGHPNMVALLSSYLFDEPVHLQSFYSRATDATDQSWTSAFVPGTRYGDKPVYVLTSGHTFSGAEEFAYNLKNLGRATIVGETTAGAAHLVDEAQLSPHFGMLIPTGRAISPITGSNWEGTGVTPDLDVPPERALAAAYKAALEHLLEGDKNQRALPEELLAEARGELAKLDDNAG